MEASWPCEETTCLQQLCEKRGAGLTASWLTKGLALWKDGMLVHVLPEGHTHSSGPCDQKRFYYSFLTTKHYVYQEIIHLHMCALEDAPCACCSPSDSLWNRHTCSFCLQLQCINSAYIHDFVYVVLAYTDISTHFMLEETKQHLTLPLSQ